MRVLEHFLLVNRIGHGRIPLGAQIRFGLLRRLRRRETMAKGCSKDLCERAVALVEEGESRRKVARVLSLAPSTTVRWLDRWATSGTVEAKPGTGHSRSPLKKRDIVFMDNVRTHKVAGVREAIEAAGARLRYLPAYTHGLKSTSPQRPYEGAAANRVSIMATTSSPEPLAVNASTSASRWNWLRSPSCSTNARKSSAFMMSLLPINYRSASSHNIQAEQSQSFSWPQRGRDFYSDPCSCFQMRLPKRAPVKH